ncbi:MAG: hypothetical protein V4531_07285 [Actinomycetota bacterium]
MHVDRASSHQALSPSYPLLLERVIGQLAGQLPPGPAVPVLIPTVGFGEQSALVLARTIRELGLQRSSVPLSVVLLVNRPQAREADSTTARARAAIAEARSPEVHFAIADVVLPERPRLGELRQLLVDAVLGVQRLDPHATACVIADDDLVHLPPGVIDALHVAIARPAGADLAIGPVLFDSPHFPAPMAPAFFSSDVLRALLSTRLVSGASSDRGDSSRPVEFSHYAESVALSANLAVRGSALQRAGGFTRDNEITGLVRGVHALAGFDGSAPVATGGLAGMWSFDPNHDDVMLDLYRSSLRISARRAFAAYQSAGSPSVSQWRACRFRASRVDPVRLHDPNAAAEQPVSTLRPQDVRQLITELEGVLTTTLRYFPPDAAVMEDCLTAIGLSPRSISLSVTEDASATTLRITSVAALLERLEEVQVHAAYEREETVG